MCPNLNGSHAWSHHFNNFRFCGRSRRRINRRVINRMYKLGGSLSTKTERKFPAFLFYFYLSGYSFRKNCDFVHSVSHICEHIYIYTRKRNCDFREPSCISLGVKTAEIFFFQIRASCGWHVSKVWTVYLYPPVYLFLPSDQPPTRGVCLI